MADLQQASVGAKARRPRLRDNAGLLASVFAHATVLVGVVLLGTPRQFATASPQPIVVDIVRPEEVALGEATRSAGTKQSQTQPQMQQQQAQPQSQQPREQQAQPQREQPQQAQGAAGQRQQQQPQPQTQLQGMQAQPSTSGAATPVFTSLYPWPEARPDVQVGDYRTFESLEKTEHHELADFKARLKQCWRPPIVSGGARRLSAALRVALRIDGSIAGAPELVEVSASPDAIALVASAKQALSECGPFGFLPADSYDSWKALSLTFSPDDIQVAAVVK
jgi:hypothetical protein